MVGVHLRGLAQYIHGTMGWKTTKPSPESVGGSTLSFNMMIVCTEAHGDQGDINTSTTNGWTTIEFPTDEHDYV